MPLPYRWLTALMMRYNGSSVLIDCGEGTQIAVKEKGWSFVCKLDYFYVYAAEEGTEDYFATPEEEGAYYPDSLKGNKFFNFIHIENLLLVVLIAAYIFILHRQTTYDWVEGFANTFPFCFLPY